MNYTDEKEVVMLHLSKEKLIDKVVSLQKTLDKAFRALDRLSTDGTHDHLLEVYLEYNKGKK